MVVRTQILILTVVLFFILPLRAQILADKSVDNPDVIPSVKKIDLQIVQRARAILSSKSKWNHADTRVCKSTAKTFSLYCALEKAAQEVSGGFEHRGAVMQQARFVIDDLNIKKKDYEHRLMDYNNDPNTTFEDIQKILRLLEACVAEAIKNQK
jgi:hypothetical protein